MSETDTDIKDRAFAILKGETIVDGVFYLRSHIWNDAVSMTILREVFHGIDFHEKKSG